MRSTQRAVSLFGVLVLSVALLATALASGAVAGSSPVTKITFKLSDHHVVVGDTVPGSVTVMTRSGHAWVPLEGATVSLTVDKVEVATLTTDAAGHADVAYVATEAGGHVMRTVFAGDDLHKRAQRAQGFEVEAAPSPAPAP